MGNAFLVKVFDFFEIPDDDIKANTINGWVMICLDRLPARGDTFTYETGNVKLDVRVTKVASRKALEINVVRTEIDDDQTEDVKGD